MVQYTGEWVTFAYKWKILKAFLNGFLTFLGYKARRFEGIFDTTGIFDFWHGFTTFQARNDKKGHKLVQYTGEWVTFAYKWKILKAFLNGFLTFLGYKAWRFDVIFDTTGI